MSARASRMGRPFFLCRAGLRRARRQRGGGIHSPRSCAVCIVPERLQQSGRSQRIYRRSDRISRPSTPPSSRVKATRQPSGRSRFSGRADRVHGRFRENEAGGGSHGGGKRRTASAQCIAGGGGGGWRAYGGRGVGRVERAGDAGGGGRRRACRDDSGDGCRWRDGRDDAGSIDADGRVTGGQSECRDAVGGGAGRHGRDGSDAAGECAGRGARGAAGCCGAGGCVKRSGGCCAGAEHAGARCDTGTRTCTRAACRRARGCTGRQARRQADVQRRRLPRPRHVATW